MYSNEQRALRSTAHQHTKQERKSCKPGVGYNSKPSPCCATLFSEFSARSLSPRPSPTETHSPSAVLLGRSPTTRQTDTFRARPQKSVDARPTNKCHACYTRLDCGGLPK